jgi:hypothetical protein
MHAHLNQIIAQQHIADLQREACAARRPRTEKPNESVGARGRIARRWLRFQRPSAPALRTPA